MLQGFEKLNIDGKDENEREKMSSEKSQQHPSLEAHRKDERANQRYHHSLNTKEAHAEKRSKSPSKVGCFQRPKLPDEIKAQAAVRDDLGKVQRMEIWKNIIKGDYLVISGHKDFNSLYASNDTVQQSFTVNILGAPNDSTTTVRFG